MSGPLTTRVVLLERLRRSSSDSSAWSEFVKQYGHLIIHWCRRYGLQSADAEDVAQDVLLRFWRKAATFHYDSSKRFRNYLRMVIHSALVEWRDSLEQCDYYLLDEQVRKLILNIPAQEDLIAKLEEAYDLELMELAMASVKQRVQPRTWQAFHLMAIEGRSGPDIAQTLGIDLSLVYVARGRVQRMIRQTVLRFEENDEQF